MTRRRTVNSERVPSKRDNAGRAVYTAHDFPRLDALDLRLMAELESDARQTYINLALKLEVSRATIASRVKRLLDGGVIRNVCWIDPLALGYELTVHLAICASPAQISNVAEKLATYAQVVDVQIYTGHFNIGAFALLRESEDLADFLTKELGAIDGILQVETVVTLRVIKAAAKLLADEKQPLHQEYLRQNLDNLDIKLIRELQFDARQRASHLATRFGLNEKTIFLRIQRLLNEHVIQIRTVINPFAFGYTGFATIGLKCDPDKVWEVAEAIASHRRVRYAAICVGRYDITSMVVYQKMRDLQHFITDELCKIPGLKDIDTKISCKLVKHFDQIPV